MAVIAVVEDRPEECDFYVEKLKKHHTVDVYKDVDEAVAGIKAKVPDLVLLDLGLGDDEEGGYTVYKEVTVDNPDLFIVFLSGQPEPHKKYAALILGAVNYIDKSDLLDAELGLDNFLRQIKNWLDKAQKFHQRPENNNAAIHDGKLGSIDVTACESNLLKMRNLKIDTVTKWVEWRGNNVSLDLAPTNILIQLVCNKGQIVNYDALIKANNGVERNTIATHVFKINSAFKKVEKKFREIKHDEDFRVIVSETNIGYRWKG